MTKKLSVTDQVLELWDSGVSADDIVARFDTEDREEAMGMLSLLTDLGDISTELETLEPSKEALQSVLAQIEEAPESSLSLIQHMERGWGLFMHAFRNHKPAFSAVLSLFLVVSVVSGGFVYEIQSQTSLASISEDLSQLGVELETLDVDTELALFEQDLRMVLDGAPVLDEEDLMIDAEMADIGSMLNELSSESSTLDELDELFSF